MDRAQVSSKADAESTLRLTGVQEATLGTQDAKDVILRLFCGRALV